MSHIFISYSHKDTAYVEKLEKKLISEGFDLWVDHRIDYGSRWTKEIEKAIDACDAYIIVMSKNSAESQWVERERIHAEKRRKPFFPLLLKGERWFSLADIQFVDVTSGELPPVGFYEKLNKEIKIGTPNKDIVVTQEKLVSDINKASLPELSSRIRIDEKENPNKKYLFDINEFIQSVPIEALAEDIKEWGTFFSKMCAIVVEDVYPHIATRKFRIAFEHIWASYYDSESDHYSEREQLRKDRLLLFYELAGKKFQEMEFSIDDAAFKDIRHLYVEIVFHIVTELTETDLQKYYSLDRLVPRLVRSWEQLLKKATEDEQIASVKRSIQDEYNAWKDWEKRVEDIVRAWIKSNVDEAYEESYRISSSLMPFFRI